MRSSTTKNHNDATLPLNAELVEALRQVVTTEDECGEPVFESIPSIEEFRADLAAAKIPFVDGQGRVVDFHSLRHTFGTNLACAGVAPRVAMELMRHSEMGLTNKVYTDPVRLPIMEAVKRLPMYSVGKEYAPGNAPKLVKWSPEASAAVHSASGGDVEQGPANAGDCQLVSSSVVGSPEREMVPRLGLEPRTN